MKFIYAVLCSILVSLISLVGVFSIFVSEKALSNIVFVLISFAAGSLIGVSFLHLIPEAVKHKEVSMFVFYYVVLGFICFFVLEKYFYWRHCHKNGSCEIHPVSYLNLIGDTIHNFIDGIVIGTSFFVDVKIGLISTIAVILHEIPQELGDIAVLIYGGFSKNRALFLNFLTALSCVLGSTVGFYLSHIKNLYLYILPLIAGGFIYISSCDLIPELSKEKDIRKSLISLIMFILGIILIIVI